jgi:hypothetical protein
MSLHQYQQAAIVASSTEQRKVIQSQMRELCGATTAERETEAAKSGGSAGQIGNCLAPRERAKVAPEALGSNHCPTGKVTVANPSTCLDLVIVALRPVQPNHRLFARERSCVMHCLSSNVEIQEFIIPSLQLIRTLVDWSAIELFFYGVFFTPRGRAALAYLFQFGSAVSFFSTLSSLLSLITIWFVLVADVVVTGIGMCPGKNRRASAIKVGRNVDLGFRRAFCIHVRRGNSLRRGNGEA